MSSGPIRKLHHALSRADYLLELDGTIRVIEEGHWGRFDRDGYWIEGELRHCDPQMCRWLAGEAELLGNAKLEAQRHRAGNST